MARKQTAAVLIAGLTVGLLAPAAPAMAAAKAAAKPVNIIRDGGAESAKPVGIGGTTIVPIAAWKPIAGTGFTAVKYGTPDFIPNGAPGPKPRGHNFFTGGEYGPSPAGATQLDSLKPYLGLIKAGKAKFTLAGWFGGWESQRDYATLTVTWQNAQGVAVGKPTVIGDVTPGKRKNVTGLFARSAKGIVPKAATQALLKLKLVRLDGGYDDGYADNLSLTIPKK